jgi:hypothetical protein
MMPTLFHVRLDVLSVALTVVYVMVDILFVHPETAKSNEILYWLGDI